MKGSRRRAFTLVEIIVASAIMIGLLWAAWGVFSTTTRQRERIEGGLEASMALRNASDRLTRELREALRLFYPSRYGHTADGVGFVNVKGHAIVVHSDGGGTEEGLSSPTRLVRSDLTTRETMVLLKNVNYFRVTLHPVPPGKDPCCVSINLSVLERGVEGAAPTVRNVVTRVFIRNLERHFPQG